MTQTLAWPVEKRHKMIEPGIFTAASRLRLKKSLRLETVGVGEQLFSPVKTQNQSINKDQLIDSSIEQETAIYTGT